MHHCNIYWTKTTENKNKGTAQNTASNIPPLLHGMHHIEGKQFAYYSKKLKSAQINFATID
jgi:hypothetical protein